MGIIMQGLKSTGAVGKLQIDDSCNLYTHDRVDFCESHNLVYGSGSTTGKATGTVANAASIYVALDCSEFPVNDVDWAITSDQQFTYQLFRSHQNELAATITLTDATAVDDTDTFVLNGLTFTAEATENDAVAAERKYWLGASNAAAAVNLAALLLDETYGVPGLSTAVITSPTTTDVITLSCDSATVLQFGQGTSAANEIAWADTTAASLWIHSAVSSNTAATTGTRGLIVNETMNGWEWAFLKLTNTSGSAAATFEVRAIRH